jgi:hypothetical protein
LNTCVSTQILARSPGQSPRSGNLTAELRVTRQTAWLGAELAGYSYAKYLLFLPFLLLFPVQILFFFGSTNNTVESSFIFSPTLYSFSVLQLPQSTLLPLLVQT